MRFCAVLLVVFVGLASLASAQRFGLTHQMFPPGADRSLAVALGDVDGDGDLDAWVANVGQNRLHRNDGTGVVEDVTAVSLPAQNDTTQAVALGDVDGDGDLDAIVGNGNDPWVLSAEQNRLYLNSGTGVFTDATATSFPARLDCTNAIALGDVDGDGDLDVVVGNSGQDRLYLNDGSGVFTDNTATSLPSVSSFTEALALGDVERRW